MSGKSLSNVVMVLVVSFKDLPGPQKAYFFLSCILISISSFFCRSHSLLSAIRASMQCTHCTCSSSHSFIVCPLPAHWVCCLAQFLVVPVVLNVIAQEGPASVFVYEGVLSPSRNL